LQKFDEHVFRNVRVAEGNAFHRGAVGRAPGQILLDTAAKEVLLVINYDPSVPYPVDLLTWKISRIKPLSALWRCDCWFVSLCMYYDRDVVVDSMCHTEKIH
jgi:hypothetical protein